MHKEVLAVRGFALPVFPSLSFVASVKNTRHCSSGVDSLYQSMVGVRLYCIKDSGVG